MGLLLAGCPPRAPAVEDAGFALDASIGGADAAVAEVVDAGPPAPADLPMVVTAPLADGGVEVVTQELDPGSRLSVWIGTPLSDYRLRVFDDADRVVPSDDAAKDVDGGIDYQIVFLEPLKTGRTYRLTIESELGNALEGFKDAELLMRVRGQVQVEPKKPSTRKRRNH
jgi:hypothetical protein